MKQCIRSLPHIGRCPQQAVEGSDYCPVHKAQNEQWRTQHQQGIAGRGNVPVRGKSLLWGMLLALPLAVQLYGWLAKKPHLMLSYHIEDRFPQAIIAFIFMLASWLFWHWGIGRKWNTSWVDLVFIAAGFAYWWIARNYPIPAPR